MLIKQLRHALVGNIAQQAKVIAGNLALVVSY
jgi:hypothetical protein